MGSLQFSVAAGASALVGVLHDGTAIPMTLVIAVCGAVADPARLSRPGAWSARPPERGSGRSLFQFGQHMGRGAGAPRGGRRNAGPRFRYGS